MSLIVVKFGGTSVANPIRIMAAANKVSQEIFRGNKVIVVVSAMAGVTNQLVEYCGQIMGGDDTPEYDAVLASGEQVTSGLMSLALQKLGLKSRSFMGWQVPIICNENHGRARIDNIPSENLLNVINDGFVPVIAGFQGITLGGRITTLGRGGSDTTAVAIAAAVKADRCDIYTDVDGVYTSDPRIVPYARKLNLVSYEEMLEMSALGAKVLHPRSVELAMSFNVPLQVLSSFDTEIGTDLPGTQIVREENIVEKLIVNGVTCSRNDSKVTLISVPDHPGVVAAIFAPLSDAAINVDMIVQNVSPDGKSTDVTFTVPRVDADRTKKIIAEIPALKGCEIRTADNLVKISIIGIGMASHTGVASMMFKTMSDKGINILAISTSEIKISILIDENYTELAVRALHTAFSLDSAASGMDRDVA